MSRGTHRSSAGALVALLLTLSLAFAGIAAADPVAKPGGPFVNPNEERNRASHLSYEDLGEELARLERRSNGALEVEVVGQSGEGRNLYVATIGEGDQRIWVQGRIHGNEPYGTETILATIRTLLAGGAHAREALEEVTFMFVPMYNPDGSEAYVRGDRVHFIDLNRDWAVTPETFDSVNAVRVARGLNPLPQSVFNNYTQLLADESQAFWYAWADFRPHYAVDIHHQGTFYEADSDRQSTFSLGISIDPAHMEPHLYDQIRQMAVVAADAAAKRGNVHPTRYPYIDIPEGVVSAMLLGAPGPEGEDPEWTTAGMFFETRGGIDQKSRGYLIRQNVDALWAIIDAVASGDLADVDPARWDDIPPRGPGISTSAKWPNLPDF